MYVVCWQHLLSRSVSSVGYNMEATPLEQKDWNFFCLHCFCNNLNVFSGKYSSCLSSWEIQEILRMFQTFECTLILLFWFCWIWRFTRFPACWSVFKCLQSLRMKIQSIFQNSLKISIKAEFSPFCSWSIKWKFDILTFFFNLFTESSNNISNRNEGKWFTVFLLKFNLNIYKKWVNSKFYFKISNTNASLMNSLFPEIFHCQIWTCLDQSRLVKYQLPMKVF